MESTRDLLPIRNDFIKSADQRLSRIGILLCELRQDREDPAVLEELHSMFHNLAGTGGACGYPRRAARLSARRCCDDSQLASNVPVMNEKDPGAGCSPIMVTSLM